VSTSPLRIINLHVDFVAAMIHDSSPATRGFKLDNFSELPVNDVRCTKVREMYLTIKARISARTSMSALQASQGDEASIKNSSSLVV